MVDWTRGSEGVIDWGRVAPDVTSSGPGARRTEIQTNSFTVTTLDSFHGLK